MEATIEQQLHYLRVRIADTLRLWYFESKGVIRFDVDKSIYRVKDGGKEVATMLLEGSFNIDLSEIFEGKDTEYSLSYVVNYIFLSLP